MPATSPLIPCSQLPRTAGYDSCLDFATTGLGACDSLNMSAMAASGDDVFNCGCVALVGSGNWGSAIATKMGVNTLKHTDEFETEVMMWVFICAP